MQLASDGRHSQRTNSPEFGHSLGYDGPSLQVIYNGYVQFVLPLLTCEVKWGTAALDIADRQNSHCMMLAVRAVIELFRYVKCEGALDREILTFSSRTTTDRWGSTITVL
ncbi:MAG: hypothetical protein FE78DRAFT_515396 [Acidomyces sp. 'richmondensis']|nr:MAG: hypothetical protein FE78DRAFT_515396 [Acidomyces sp. 'richmondensis']